MAMQARPFAVVTGASSGIGFELAKCCAKDGYDLLIVADEPEIYSAAEDLNRLGANVEAVEADLATQQGVDKLYESLRGRAVDALLANAGRGLGHAFLDQNWDEVYRLINTNVTGTLYLIHKIGNDMRRRRQGKILITGSIAGYMPGSFQAAYNASKAFLDSFAEALRNEMKDTGVTVTCLMPGATETEFFARAGLMDTKIGQQEKADPADVARLGYEAMKTGDDSIIAGWKNKMQAMMARVLPATVVAEQHRKQTEPGSGRKH